MGAKASRWVVAVLFAFLAGAVSVAGCGGGDDATAEVLSKSAFIKRADAICGKTEERQNTRLQEFAKREKEPTPKAQQELLLFAGLPPVTQEAEELTEIEELSPDPAQFKAYVAELERAVAAAEKDPGAMLGGGTNFFEKAEEMAIAYGFKVCRGA